MTRLVSLAGWERVTRASRRRMDPLKCVDYLIVGASGADVSSGVCGVEEYLRFTVNDPRAGGRGLLDATSHILIPQRCDTVEKKLETFQVLPDQAVECDPLGPSNNHIRVEVLGRYRSRDSLEPETPFRVDRSATSALLEIIEDHLLPRHLLTWENVFTDRDMGRPGSPGDFLEQLVMSKKNKSVPSPEDSDFYGDDAEGDLDRRDLSSVDDKLKALHILRLPVDARDGWSLRNVAILRAFQESRRLDPTGQWDRLTDREIRRELRRRSIERTQSNAPAPNASGRAAESFARPTSPTSS